MGGRTSRKQRAEKANRSLLRCRGCGGWRVGPHFDPWTKTYICKKEST